MFTRLAPRYAVTGLCFCFTDLPFGFRYFWGCFRLHIANMHTIVHPSYRTISILPLPHPSLPWATGYILTRFPLHYHVILCLFMAPYCTYH